MTNDATFTMTGQRVAFDDERVDEVIMGQKVLMNHLAKNEAPVIGGTTQTSTVYFALQQAVKGLKMIQKTWRGKIGPFTMEVVLGDYEAGDHKFTFEPNKVPDGFLERGLYKQVVQYLDSHGKVLLEYTSHFRIVKKKK